MRLEVHLAHGLDIIYKMDGRRRCNIARQSAVQINKISAIFLPGVTASIYRKRFDFGKREYVVSAMSLS